MTGNVSIDDIRERLLVSHDWMADSFVVTLEEINDQDLLNLFKALNTVVISYEIRPSFYHSLTASMYIDPRYLWRNSSEWETIYTQEDFRSSYQSEFTFDSFLRYVEAGSSDYVTWSNSYDEGSYFARTESQIAPGLFRLLSHELAHANDYLPPELVTSLGDSGRIFHDYIYPGIEINDDLYDAIPLTSDLLFEAAGIAYQGEDMTDRIRNASAADAGGEFDDDGAADFYGYSTKAEDVAMLFEAYMMYKKYNAVSDVAFVAVPEADSPSCDDYIVKWGQRGRLADSDVKQRAIMVSNRLLDKDISSDLSSLPSAPIDISLDMGWCASRYGTISVTGTPSYESTSVLSDSKVVHHFTEDMLRE